MITIITALQNNIYRTENEMIVKKVFKYKTNMNISLSSKLLKEHTHSHTRLTALCPGLPGWASTRKVKQIWILLKQETVCGSVIICAICKYAPRSKVQTERVSLTSLFQTENHASTQSLSFFTGQMPSLPPNQQRQSTEGKKLQNC